MFTLGQTSNPSLTWKKDDVFKINDDDDDDDDDNDNDDDDDNELTQI